MTDRGFASKIIVPAHGTYQGLHARDDRVHCSYQIARCSKPSAQESHDHVPRTSFHGFGPQRRPAQMAKNQEELTALGCRVSSKRTSFPKPSEKITVIIDSDADEEVTALTQEWGWHEVS